MGLPLIVFIVRGGMRGPLFRGGSEELCRSCHDAKNEDWAGRSLYEQWRVSPYGVRDGGLACIDCHESPAGDGVECSRSGRVDSTRSPKGLPGAASLAVIAWERGGQVEADVSVSNSGVGHLFPSGTTSAFVVLEVYGIADDGSKLEPSSGSILSPEAESHFGRFGVVFALKPGGDDRLAPFATHRSRYVFVVDDPERVTIVARLALCRGPKETGSLCEITNTVAREIRR